MFWKLFSQLHDSSLLRNTIHVSVEEQLAMFLHIVDHKLRNCVIALYFKRFGKIVSQYFSEVLIDAQLIWFFYARPLQYS